MEDEPMKAEDEATYERIRDELLNGKDEVIVSSYLKRMIVNGDSWPEHFIEDVELFDKNPNEDFHAERPIFVIVKPRTTDIYGRTEGCDSGCWRIIGRDKLIKSKETEKFLGFKKILKFCKKTNPKEYKRSWVMEEYRLVNKWNWKQDHVICKIRFLFEAEISFLLFKHFSYLPTTKTVPDPAIAKQYLPAYGVCVFNTEAESLAYLWKIIVYDGNSWPDYVANDVYRLHPLTLVDPQDDRFKEFGTCIFAKRTKSSGKTDECDGGGCWRIIQGYSDTDIKLETGEILGYRSLFKFWENGEPICEFVLDYGLHILRPNLKPSVKDSCATDTTVHTMGNIPFSSSEIREIQRIFGAGENSSMAEIISSAVSECERPPSHGETKRCVGSAEDMIDFATSVLGRGVVVRTTENVVGSKKKIVIGKVKGINGGNVTRAVSCHQSLYPYLLYYCHAVPRVRVYEADLLDPESLEKINHGVAICHIDTSAWSPSHGAFLALGSGPGRIEVCHWIFENDITWNIVD